jgi:hypothetical protein
LPPSRSIAPSPTLQSSGIHAEDCSRAAALQDFHCSSRRRPDGPLAGGSTPPPVISICSAARHRPHIDHICCAQYFRQLALLRHRRHNPPSTGNSRCIDSQGRPLPQPMTLRFRRAPACRQALVTAPAPVVTAQLITAARSSWHFLSLRHTHTVDQHLPRQRLTG